MKLFLFLIKIIFIFNLFVASAICEPSNLFKTKIHKEINTKTLEKVLKEINLTLDKNKFKLCRKNLNSTQIFQDYVLFASSRAHFDNCTFQRSIKYINRLIKRNKSFAAKYQMGFKTGRNQRDLDLLRRKIMVNTGKIIHTAQDFYSHSNYVELMELKHSNIADVPLIKVWEEEGQEQILEMQKKNNLISGTAWWVFPKKCSKKSPSHSKLTKDSMKFDMGKRPTIWKDKETKKTLNGFDVAYRFAEESTYEFLLQTFKTYPLLKDYCGIVNP